MRRPRRFDDAFLVPPESHGEVDKALLAEIRRWCEEGAFPALTEPLKVREIAASAGLDGVAAEMDGSHELARLSRLGGLGWRLQILARECLGSGRSPVDAPWDCGWWRAGSMEAAEAFRPRRPTLVLVKEQEPAVAEALVEALRANSDLYREPVRVLSVGLRPTSPMEALG